MGVSGFVIATATSLSPRVAVAAISVSSFLLQVLLLFVTVRGDMPLLFTIVTGKLGVVPAFAFVTGTNGCSRVIERRRWTSAAAFLIDRSGDNVLSAQGTSTCSKEERLKMFIGGREGAKENECVLGI